MHSACIVSVQCIDSACTQYVHCLCNGCKVQLRFINCARTSMYSTWRVNVDCIYTAYRMHLKCMFSVCANFVQ